MGAVTTKTVFRCARHRQRARWFSPPLRALAVPHFLPLLGIVTFFLVGFVLRAAIQYARHGHTGLVVFKDQDWRGHLRDASFLLLSGMLILQSLLRALAPAALEDRLLLATGPATVFLGALLVFGGTGLMLTAQLAMGASWRVGIDEAARPGLVTSGLYRICRNPIYLALFLVLAGMLLLLPTLVTVMASLGIWFGIRTQTLHEEQYLLRTYGDEYRRYASRVGRFLPGLGRLELR
jgi:protein-S-isoprenylcysteine O-methyltransferase Ste14